MNPNSKDPMVRMFARMEKQQEEELAKLERAKKALTDISKDLEKF